MLKKTIISGALLISILLVGCNGEPEVIDTPENDANLSPEPELLSELHTEIRTSITEQTGFDSESIESIAIVGSPVKAITDISISFSKDTKVDDTMIQQIVEDSMKKVFETENVAYSKEDITIKIEKY